MSDVAIWNVFHLQPLLASNMVDNNPFLGYRDCHTVTPEACPLRINTSERAVCCSRRCLHGRVRAIYGAMPCGTYWPGLKGRLGGGRTVQPQYLLIITPAEVSVG